MANKHESLSSLFTAIADKLRKKTGKTGTLVADDFPDILETIQTPVDGSIEANTADEVVVSGSSISIPAGYYAEDVSKSVQGTEQATPSINVGTDGKITATSTQSEGYVVSGSKTNTLQMDTQAGKTVTPTSTEQVAVAAGVYTTGDVKVAAMTTVEQADPVISVGTDGKITATVTQPAGYLSGGTTTDTEQLATKAAATITPTKSSQTAVGKNVYTTGVITVGAIPAAYQDVTSVTAGAGDVLTGKTIVAADGTKVSGTMANQGAKTAALNAGGSYTIPAGYHNGSGKITANSLASQTDGTAGAGDILYGKTAYVDGAKVTGNIPSKSSTDLTASGATVSVPAGYYASAASKSVATATQATPSVSVNTTTGVITATATQTAGYVSAGSKSGTKQLTTQAAKTVTPSTSEQTAVASGVYTTGAIKVAAMPTATQATPSISIDSAGKITASATQSAGYVASGTKSATKQMTTKGATTITPSTSKQTAVASGVYTTGAIEVAAMPTATQATPSISVSSAGLITASATQSAGYVAAGTKSGTKQLTTQAAKTVTPGTSNQTAVAAGVYTTGAITVAGDADLVAGNILAGVTIFGVTGTVKKDAGQLPEQVDNVAVARGNLSAILTWTRPVVDQNNSYAGVKIVRKTGSCPTSDTDGTVVYNGSATEYTDSGLTNGTTYYYRFFAYNSAGALQNSMRYVSVTATNGYTWNKHYSYIIASTKTSSVVGYLDYRLPSENYLALNTSETLSYDGSKFITKMVLSDVLAYPDAFVGEFFYKENDSTKNLYMINSDSQFLQESSAYGDYEQEVGTVVTNVSLVTGGKGAFIESVKSQDINAYPAAGYQDGYYYELIS